MVIRRILFGQEEEKKAIKGDIELYADGEISEFLPIFNISFKGPSYLYLSDCKHISLYSDGRLVFSRDGGDFNAYIEIDKLESVKTSTPSHNILELSLKFEGLIEEF